MVRRSLTLILAIFLIVPPVSARPVASFASVTALQHQGQTFCTTFYLGSRYWGTAAHCAIAAIQRSYDVTIDGQAAWVAYIDPVLDIAVYESDAKAKPVKLAKDGPAVGDSVSIVGYPYGITKTITIGIVSARNIPILHPTYKIPMASDILDITVAGGNSGSPVFNAKGEVVGILWGGFVDSPHALSIPFEGVSRVLGPFMVQ
jgi:V8-like Glu-specific endopeptidase